MRYALSLLFLSIICFNLNAYEKCLPANIDDYLNIEVVNRNSKSNIDAYDFLNIKVSLKKQNAQKILGDIPIDFETLIPCFSFDCCKEDFKVISGANQDTCEMYSNQNIAQRKWIVQAIAPGKQKTFFSLSFRSKNNNLPQIDICEPVEKIIEVGYSNVWFWKAFKENWYKYAAVIIASVSFITSLGTFSWKRLKPNILRYIISSIIAIILLAGIITSIMFLS